MIFLIFFLILIIFVISINTIYTRKEKFFKKIYTKNFNTQSNINKEIENYIMLINVAIINGKELCIKYISHKITGETEITVRNIIPIKICSGKELNLIKPLKNCEWYENEKYLYAFCKLRDEERYFRIDRILSVEILNDNYDNFKIDVNMQVKKKSCKKQKLKRGKEKTKERLVWENPETKLDEWIGNLPMGNEEKD